jgi:hypothetical protein
MAMREDVVQRGRSAVAALQRRGKLRDPLYTVVGRSFGPARLAQHFHELAERHACSAERRELALQ